MMKDCRQLGEGNESLLQRTCLPNTRTRFVNVSGADCEIDKTIDN